jgi:hypothetical protein
MAGNFGLGDRWSRLWQQLQASQAELPSYVPIPPEHDLDLGSDRARFEVGEHYFSVVIDQMFLRDGREWLSRYEPLVFVVSEFAYDGEWRTVPFVVGAPLLESTGRKLPDGMLYSQTRVAGLHPYRGAGLKLTVILYKIESRNYGRELLELTQTVTRAIDFATALVPYIKIASAVFDGVEALLARDTTAPVVGSRNEFASNGAFVPAHYALIDRRDVDPSRLWVSNGSLMTGPSCDELTPYRDADFVLYGIGQSTERDDLSLLPLDALWRRVQREAAIKGAEAWESATANMVSLYQDMILSPDLTERQSAALAEKYGKTMVAIHDNIPSLQPTKLGPADEGGDGFRDARERSVAMLRLQ